MVYKETMAVQKDVNTAKLNDAIKEQQPLESEKDKFINSILVILGFFWICLFIIRNLTTLQILCRL
jgi:hypothetical protein